MGDNNSGKSYLMSLLWGIRNLGGELLYADETMEITETYGRLRCWVKKQIETAREQGVHTVLASEIGDELQSVLQERINQNRDKFVKAIFNSSDVEIEELQIELTGLAGVSLDFIVREYGRNMGVAITNTGNDGVELALSEKERATGILEEKTGRYFVNTLMALVLDSHGGFNREIYFPAARTGFMLTKDIINKVSRRTTFNVAAEQETMVPFVRPINQFLDVINDLTFDGESNEDFKEIVQYLENGMADGTVEMSALPNKEAMYVPNGKTSGMPLRITSAVVTELSPLILILKYKRYVDALFYEEPEMCLHPQLQQKMGRVLCKMVNAGVQMNVTTHSDIILQHVNNMIRLSGREDREEICHQLGYMARDLLSPQKVKVYQLKAVAGGKTKVEELNCGENGFAVPTFNDALDRIMDEAYVIQE
ncbi:AAA family ATPase [uncultured Acetatifactor sp.]|uniref:AAA family ATPase n=1 Tax=uncultured Acetatifactor sp. TaxID=1671927 RepID=UPI002617FB04|nr:AAA family ATPase [uncultured Acetatifactor sp.]